MSTLTKSYDDHSHVHYLFIGLNNWKEPFRNSKNDEIHHRYEDELDFLIEDTFRPKSIVVSGRIRIVETKCDFYLLTVLSTETIT